MVNLSLCILIEKPCEVLKNTPFQYVTQDEWDLRLHRLKYQHETNVQWFKHMVLQKEHRNVGQSLQPLYQPPESAASEQAVARDTMKQNEKQKLMAFLFNCAADDGLRRTEKAVYAPTITPEGQNTRCYEHIADMDPWIRHQVCPRPVENHWFGMKGDTPKYLVSHLGHDPDPRFPFLERCRTLFSFRNGIYCAHVLNSLLFQWHKGERLQQSLKRGLVVVVDKFYHVCVPCFSQFGPRRKSLRSNFALVKSMCDEIALPRTFHGLNAFCDGILAPPYLLGRQDHVQRFQLLQVNFGPLQYIVVLFQQKGLLRLCTLRYLLTKCIGRFLCLYNLIQRRLCDLLHVCVVRFPVCLFILRLEKKDVLVFLRVGTFPIIHNAEVTRNDVLGDEWGLKGVGDLPSDKSWCRCNCCTQLCESSWN